MDVFCIMVGLVGAVTLISHYTEDVEVFMTHYIPLDQRETGRSNYSNRSSRPSRPMETRGCYVETNTEPLRRPMWLWVISISILRPDGLFTHAVTYTVAPTDELAIEMGWRAAYRDYPLEEGFTEHDIVLLRVDPSHLKGVTR